MPTFLAIDLKSYYASVECVERGLDPLTTNLVVADESRTDKTICLAVSPSLKAYGISGRARLFEVKQFLKQHYQETGEKIPLIVAPPRMQFYIDYSQQIYDIYTSFFSPKDIHIYSIDEVFIDATSYMGAHAMYRMSPTELANTVVQKIYEQTGITATAGIGTNLYLAKISMDILAKHAEPNEFGCRVAELDEHRYRELLWVHQPLTDFWRIGRGISKRLCKHGIKTMGDLARVSLHPHGEEFLYKLFGIDTEILIDHAWGIETTRMQDIKNYEARAHSISNGQVLSRGYTKTEGETILREMIEELCLQLTEKHLLTNQIVVDISFDKTSKIKDPKAILVQNFYGQIVPKPVRFYHNFSYTNNTQLITDALVKHYRDKINPDAKIKRYNLSANHVIFDNAKYTVQLDLFAQNQKQNLKNSDLQKALLKIKQRYGKNAILTGTNFESGSTARERHLSIGGHQA